MSSFDDEYEFAPDCFNRPATVGEAALYLLSAGALVGGYVAARAVGAVMAVVERARKRGGRRG